MSLLRCNSITALFTCLAIFFLVTPVRAKYSGVGNGEPDNPYRIADANHMNEIGTHTEDWGSHFLLVNDINLADYTGTQFNIISIFTGVFDGNNHEISNFTYESSASGLYYKGIFGTVNDSSAIIENLDLLAPNVNLNSTRYVGALVGRLQNGTITNCHVTGGTVSALEYIGGLVGSNHGGTILNCYSSVNISGKTSGGLVGYNESGKIVDCRATGSVSGSVRTGGLVGQNFDTISNSYATGIVSGNDETGGLVGGNYGATTGKVSNSYATGYVTGTYKTGGLLGRNESESIISNCYATGTVVGSNNHTGGLIGYNRGSVSFCYATGDVSGNDYTGCFVGYNEAYYDVDAPISNCYSAGSVSGHYNVSTLVGYNYHSSISNCYIKGSITFGASYKGTIVGHDDNGTYVKCFWDSDINPDVNGMGDEANDPNVIGKSTAEMQKEITFTDAGWDFIEIWNIGENQTCPYLRVYPAGDLNHNRSVDLEDFAIFAEHWLEDNNP